MRNRVYVVRFVYRVTNTSKVYLRKCFIHQDLDDVIFKDVELFDIFLVQKPIDRLRCVVDYFSYLIKVYSYE